MKFSKRTKRIALSSVILVAVLLFCIFLLPHLVVLTLPFIIAYLIAKLIEPAVAFLTEKVKIPRKISSAILVVVSVSALVGIIILLGNKIAEEIRYLLSHTGDIANTFTEILKRIEGLLNGLLGKRFSAAISSHIDYAKIGDMITEYLNGHIGPVIEKTFEVVKRLPNVLVFIIALILGTYFISSDRKRISSSIKSFVPQNARVHLSAMKNDLLKALFGYVRAQLLLMTITFFECTVGLLVIGGSYGKYALLIAFVISVIDMIPVLGTGTVLIPWGIYSLVTGSTRVGITLLILYLICLLVRQLLEPKIVGKQIGLHPLITLMTMYAGLNLIGFVGMILGPIIALIIKNLAEGGFFKTIKNYLLCNEENTNEEV